MKTGARALLRLHHRRDLWNGALWVVAAGLTLDLVFARLGATAAFRLTALGVVLGGAILARVCRRPSAQETARELDAQIGARNRIEAVAELEGRDDPLAAAIRAETDGFLRSRPAPRSFAWWIGLALLAALLVYNVAGFNPWNVGPATAPRVAAASLPAAQVVPPPPEPPAPPTAAALRWLVPEYAVSAHAKEELPLTVQAESAAGLNHLTLHVTLDCDARPDRPLPNTVDAGSQTVPLALILEDLAAQPYDIVTYHLSAQRVRPGVAANAERWPAIFSPLQFVEIRPLRDDPVPEAPPGGDGTADVPGYLLGVVRQLKLTQMNVVRSAFGLDHDLPARSDPAWPALCAALESDQKSASDSLAQLVALTAGNPVPSEATALLIRAHADLERAAAALARRDLAAALPPARCALSAIAHAENYFADFVLEQRRAAPPPPPAATPPLTDLPPREQTPEGRLEKLANEQQSLVEQLTEAALPAGTFAQEDRLARELEKLAAENRLPAETIAAIKGAAAAAREAAAQLNEQDARAATEPATRAAQALKEAVAQREAASRAQASTLLAAAQRVLLRAAGDVRGATPATTREILQRAAEQTTATRDTVRKGALREQQQGSAAVAEQLNALAEAIERTKIVTTLTALAAQGEQAAREAKLAAAQTLTRLAGQAGEGRARLDDSGNAQARALDELQRARANLERAADAGAEAMEALHERAQAAAQAVNADAELPVPPQAQDGPPGAGKAGGGGVAGTEGEWFGGFRGALHRYAVDLAPHLDRTIKLLDSRLRETKRAHTLATGNPSEAPPAYRPAVSEYFESLSREPVPAAPRAPAAGARP